MCVVLDDDRFHTRAASFAGGSTFNEQNKIRNKKILKTRKFGAKFTKDDNYFREHRNRKISVLKSLPKSLPPEKIFGGFQELQLNGKNKNKKSKNNNISRKTVNIVNGNNNEDESMTPMAQLSKTEDSLFIGKNLVISTNNYGDVIIHKNISNVGENGIGSKNMKNYNNLSKNMPIRLPSQSSLSSVSSSRPMVFCFIYFLNAKFCFFRRIAGVAVQILILLFKIIKIIKMLHIKVQSNTLIIKLEV